MLHFAEGVELVAGGLVGVAAEVPTVDAVAGLPSKAPNESVIAMIVEVPLPRVLIGIIGRSDIVACLLRTTQVGKPSWSSSLRLTARLPLLQPSNLGKLRPIKDKVLPRLFLDEVAKLLSQPFIYNIIS